MKLWVALDQICHTRVIQLLDKGDRGKEFTVNSKEAGNNNPYSELNCLVSLE